MSHMKEIYVRKIKPDNKVQYILRSLDLDSVESWEFVDNDHTRVFMFSGDTMVCKIFYENFKKSIMEEVDGYGRLIVFNEN